MAAKKPNPWRDAHRLLDDEKKITIREAIMQACEWSQDTFYRKMRNPNKLKYWEKTIVAKKYRKPVTTLFPETTEQMAA